MDFRPVFSSSVTSPVTTEARELCGSNTDCLFDLHVTGSRDIAQSSRQFTYQLQQAADAARPGKPTVIIIIMLRDQAHLL